MPSGVYERKPRTRKWLRLAPRRDRGPGTHTPRETWDAFARLVFAEACSIRQASERVGIAKGTGRAIYWALRARRAA